MNKMRDSLSLMSLSSFSYSVSFFLLQGFFGALSGVIIGIGMYNNANIFPDDPKWNSI